MFEQQVNSKIKLVIESEYFLYLIWLGIVAIFFIHYLRNHTRNIAEDFFITDKFGNFMDHAIAGVGHATAITTSITLLKGLYIQAYFGEPIYYAQFNTIDKSSLGIVISFLLYFNCVKVFEVFKLALNPPEQIGP
ncbi:MAG: hypothetical protein WBO44_05220 [Saprospiraceae bacterium]